MKLPPRVINDADPSALTIEEALLRIRNALPQLKDVQTVDCLNALGRITAADIHSPMSVPPFRASAMDGFAVRVADCHSALRLDGQSMAGHPGSDRLAPGSCQRITTGARVPDDADAVVQQENTECNDGTVTIRVMPQPGLNVRNPGTDSRQDDLLINAGTRLGPSQLALLAAHGVSNVEVVRKLVVALFSTGDELRKPGNRLEPGQIYDANRPLLQSMLHDHGVEVIDLGICKDSEAALEQRLSASQDADLVISSGGVSVGEADHVRQVLARAGQINFWKIAMKPGRPLTFGISRPGQAYFGLPGNPVSAALTTLLFVLPSIRHMLGRSLELPPALQLPLTDELHKNPGRVEYQRAIMQQDANGNWQVGTTGLQDSHVLSSLHKANCLIELKSDSQGAAIGDSVRVFPFSHFAEPVL
ncbi:molybdopterin molybdotransferase MoeA [Granulosicoccus sp. 3-233]|uniref:molybdopterin molybdotransferase MoeA n=1 Tax=Granulosicoccus sp. 3-233 TaxID=3417969 RepID=UPI003D347F1C